MKRTKDQNPQPMRRTRQPDTLPDGRILGQKTEDAVPKSLRDAIPSAKPRKKNTYARRHLHDINMLCRTRMPLALTPDGEVDLAEKKIRLKGLNQAKFNALIAGIKSGMRIAEAAKLIGMSDKGVLNWIKRGEKGEAPYVLISATLKQAEAELEQSLLEAIRQAGTVRLDYEERIEEVCTDDHGQQTTKTVTKSKVKFPQFQAAAWILERTRPEVYRSDREVEGVDMVDIAEEIEAMRQISDVRLEGGE